MGSFEFQSLDGKLRVDLYIYLAMPHVLELLVGGGYLYPLPIFLRQFLLTEPFLALLVIAFSPF